MTLWKCQYLHSTPNSFQCALSFDCIVIRILLLFVFYIWWGNLLFYLPLNVALCKIAPTQNVSSPHFSRREINLLQNSRRDIHKEWSWFATEKKLHNFVIRKTLLSINFYSLICGLHYKVFFLGLNVVGGEALNSDVESSRRWKKTNAKVISIQVHLALNKLINFIAFAQELFKLFIHSFPV